MDSTFIEEAYTVRCYGLDCGASVLRSGPRRRAAEGVPRSRPPDAQRREGSVQRASVSSPTESAKRRASFAVETARKTTADRSPRSIPCADPNAPRAAGATQWQANASHIRGDATGGIW